MLSNFFSSFLFSLRQAWIAIEVDCKESCTVVNFIRVYFGLHCIFLPSIAPGK